MIKKLLLLFVIIGNILYSQQKEFSHDYILKFSALDLFTGFLYQSSTIQLGLEGGISNNLSINSELGYSLYINRKGNILCISLDNLSGFAFETEVRKYIDEEKPKFVGQYFSIDFLYRYLDVKNHHWAYLRKDENYIENYSTFRNESAIHLKYGYQNISVKGFVSDFSIGIGWRYITSRSNNAYPLSLIENEFPYNKPFSTGSKSFFSVTAAIRIGWSLK